MNTGIIILNRLDCDAEYFNEKTVENIVKYLGSRCVKEYDTACPVIQTKVDLTEDDKIVISGYAVENYQTVMFLEDVDFNDIRNMTLVRKSENLKNNGSKDSF